MNDEPRVKAAPKWTMEQKKISVWVDTPRNNAA